MSVTADTTRAQLEKEEKIMEMIGYLLEYQDFVDSQYFKGHISKDTFDLRRLEIQNDYEDLMRKLYNVPSSFREEVQ
jgi:hypothetical protein|tara:strand:- start:4066 stop:4296 length:231 start_codon:yes stop_codon:yes gene_type:complete